MTDCLSKLYIWRVQSCVFLFIFYLTFYLLCLSVFPFSSSERLSERRKVRIRHVLAHEIPLEVRPVDPLKYLRLAANATAPKTMFWVKAKGHIGELE